MNVGRSPHAWPGRTVTPRGLARPQRLAHRRRRRRRRRRRQPLGGLAPVDDPSVSVGLLSAAVTALGMIGLFFIPAACSRQLPDVIRRRAAERRADAGRAALDDA
ncbi:hypothetical protein ACWCV9_34590 [Streptomyces sp. NPDC001606]